MHRIHLTLAPIALAFCLIVAHMGAAPAAAQAIGYDSMDGCAPSWTQQFGSDVLILDCKPGYATDHDRLYMYTRGSVNRTTDWRSVADFENATWLFDVGARGRVSLMLEFRREGSALVADFFDDVDGDGEIRYGFDRGRPKSVEARYPTLRVTAPDGWWVRGRTINYNLRLASDGPVLASYMGELFLDWVATNGHPDVLIEVHESSPGSGRPRWEIRQAQPDGTDDGATHGIYRTLVMSNEADDELTPTTYILWPHLGYAGDGRPAPPAPARRGLASIPAAAYGMVKDYNSTYPPIQVDWEAARIKTVGEFVASRGRPQNWFTYSLLRAGRPGLTTANFENPFAFYDVAGVGDGYPDLQIRDVFYPAEDPFAPSTAGANLHEIRYSWDHNHAKAWTYKIGLAGHRPTARIVELTRGISLATVPYREFPRWVMSHAWDIADFVAYERDYWTTEGLYETCGPMRWPEYFSGHSARRPTLSEMLPVTNPGSRCEFASRLGEPPQLYLSAVDRKLHLYRAEAGQWTLIRQPGDNRPIAQLRYRALAGPFIDYWERLESGLVVQLLAHVAGRIVYADPDGVSISRGPDAPALLYVDPPTDRASMERLKAQLAGARRPGEGANLLEIFREFQDDLVVIPGAQVWDVRPEGAGFRAMLLLNDPVPDLPLTAGRPAGTYVLTYSPGGIALRPAQPPRLALSAPTVRGNPPAVQAPTRLAVRLRNEGDHDVRAATVSFLVGPQGRTGRLIGSATVDVPAGAEVAAEVVWMPSEAGSWAAQALANSGAASTRAELAVPQPPPVDPSALLLAQGLRPFTVGAMTASLTLVAAIAVGLGFVIWQGSASRSTTRRDG